MIAAHGWAAGAAVPARACQQMMGRHRPGGRPGARRFRYPCNETSIQVRSLVLRRVTTGTGAKHPAIVRRTQHGAPADDLGVAPPAASGGYGDQPPFWGKVALYLGPWGRGVPPPKTPPAR